MEINMGQSIPPYTDVNQQNNNYQIQTSITIKDQTQSYSNSTMCHTLSAAENLAYRICLENNNPNYIFQFFQGYKPILMDQYQDQNLIFDFYDSFDGGKKKPIKDLAMQLIFLIENFKGDYSHYKSHYQKYDYPSNLSQEQVCEIIFHWYNIIKRIELDNKMFRQYQFSKYYFNLLLVLKDQESYNYTQDIFKLEAGNPNQGKINPSAAMDAFGKINQHNDKYISDNALTKNVVLGGQNTLKTNNDVGSVPSGIGGEMGGGRGGGIGGGRGRGGERRGQNKYNEKKSNSNYFDNK